MKKIVKIIYQDGSEEELTNSIIPRKTSKTDDYSEKYANQCKIERQFIEFENKILKSLVQDNIKDYAINNFDLVDEDDVEDCEDCEEKELYDFSDEELFQELISRKLLGYKNSIISHDFIDRFIDIVEREDQIILDNWLSEMEKKINN